VAGVDLIIGDYLGPGDTFVTYLPLAHIFEFVFENALLYWGGTMGYGNPKTLSDGSMRNCAGDIREFKPTVLIGVPAVWESVRKGVLAKVAAGNLVVRNMFWGAMAAKSMMMYTGAPGAGVLDSVVFKKVKDATGGRLRICLNGGGPISKETQRFVSLAIAPMVNGYGLTETAAMGAFMDPAAWTDDALGELPGSIEMKLVDFEDAGYFASNDPPQGEIWIRGDSVTEGYLELEKETKESFTDDGWFKTGDIGQFDSQGQLKIIDRKKNLVKMQHGEYIALEKVRRLPLLLDPVYERGQVHARARTSADCCENTSSSSPPTAPATWWPTSACTRRRTRTSPSPSSCRRSRRSRSWRSSTASLATASRTSRTTDG